MGIFLKDIRRFVVETKVKQDLIVAQVVEDVVASVVELSPVDTGNFVSNWLLGIDKAVPWGVTGTKNPDKDASITRIISRIPVDAANHTYNLVNNSSYAHKLETGEGMKHAPYAMIKITELRMPGIIRRVLSSNGIK